LSKQLDIVITGNDESVVGAKSDKMAGGKPLSFFVQLRALLSSLERNWKSDVPHRVYFVHSFPLSHKYKRLLDRFSVEVVHRPVNVSGLHLFTVQREQRLDVYREGGFGGTHMLLLDYDVLCLQTPQLDYSKDMQVMYAGASFQPHWDVLFKACGIDVAKAGYDLNKGGMFRAYHLHDYRNLFPHFNHGVVFVRSDFAKAIVGDIERLIDVLSRCKELPNFRLQIASCVAMLQNTTNWALLPKGCNFLNSVMTSKEWGKPISLYHYLGKGKKSFEVKLYGEYVFPNPL